MSDVYETCHISAVFRLECPSWLQSECAPAICWPSLAFLPVGTLLHPFGPRAWKKLPAFLAPGCSTLPYRGEPGECRVGGLHPEARLEGAEGKSKPRGRVAGGRTATGTSHAGAFYSTLLSAFLKLSCEAASKSNQIFPLVYFMKT